MSFKVLGDGLKLFAPLPQPWPLSACRGLEFSSAWASAALPPPLFNKRPDAQEQYTFQWGGVQEGRLRGVT